MGDTTSTSTGSANAAQTVNQDELTKEFASLKAEVQKLMTKKVVGISFLS